MSKRSKPGSGSQSWGCAYTAGHTRQGRRAYTIARGPGNQGPGRLCLYRGPWPPGARAASYTIARDQARKPVTGSGAVLIYQGTRAGHTRQGGCAYTVARAAPDHTGSGRQGFKLHHIEEMRPDRLCLYHSQGRPPGLYCRPYQARGPGTRAALCPGQAGRQGVLCLAKVLLRGYPGCGARKARYF